MDLLELEEVLKEERSVLEERESKLEEACWFVERLKQEDYNSPNERINIENDLKIILQELVLKIYL